MPALIDTDDHQTVFQNLLDMMRDVVSDEAHFNDIMGYIAQCAQSENCTVRDLCSHSGRPIKFACDAQGQLSLINFSSCKLHGFFNLSTIPRTVTKLHLSHNRMLSIGNLTDLRGSSLRYLHIERIRTLKLDFNVFQDKQNPLPLKVLFLSSVHMGMYFGLSGVSLYAKIGEWIQGSTLEFLVCRSSRGGNMHFDQTGRIKSKAASIMTSTLLQRLSGDNRNEVRPLRHILCKSDASD